MLVVVPGPIDPEQSAGSRLVADLLVGLEGLGCEVKLCVDSMSPALEICESFQPEVIVLSWPGISARLLPALQNHPAALIYLGHDLAFRRVAAGDELKQPAWSGRAEVVRLLEERSWRLADLSLYPDPLEASYVESVVGPGSALGMVPYLIDRDRVADRSSTPGRDLCFVGGPLHAPNLDGVEWLRDNVHRNLFRSGALGMLHVFGYWTEADLRGDLEGVILHGPLSDDQLDEAMSSCRIAVAPLRFGAGVKRKVVHYLSLGLPLVATSVALEGVHPDPEGGPLALVADDPESWRVALLRLRDDEDRRSLQVQAGLRAVESGYTKAAYYRNLAEVLASAKDRRQRREGVRSAGALRTVRP